MSAKRVRDLERLLRKKKHELKVNAFGSTEDAAMDMSGLENKLTVLKKRKRENDVKVGASSSAFPTLLHASYTCLYT